MKVSCEFRKNYSVDESGVVRRIEPGRGTRVGQILKPNKNTGGYYQVCLMNNGKGKNFLVHRLVAEKYIQNPNNYPQVNHINGIKTDNSINNLEWCNASYNGKHAYEFLGHPRTALPGEMNGRSKLTNECVERIRLLRASGSTLTAIGDEFGVSASLVSQILSGKRWKHIPESRAKHYEKLRKRHQEAA